MSTFIGFLMPNAFLFEQTVLFQTMQFSISTRFNCQRHVYFKLFGLVKQLFFQTIKFSVSTVSISKTILFQTVQFSISTQFTRQNSSISSNFVLHKYTA